MLYRFINAMIWGVYSAGIAVAGVVIVLFVREMAKQPDGPHIGSLANTMPLSAASSSANAGTLSSR